MQTREWQLDLGPYTGKVGEVKTLIATPQVFYRVINIVATDTAPSPGQGTRIGKLIVGNKLQRPSAIGSTLTSIVGADASTLSARLRGGTSEGGLYWDMCPPGSQILAEVIFVVACTFDLTLFGVARN